VTGVETDQRELLPANVVISDCGIATYLRLLEQDAPRSRKRCERLLLQSPGVNERFLMNGRQHVCSDRWLMRTRRRWGPKNSIITWKNS
jgi:hypothetical protein